MAIAIASTALVFLCGVVIVFVIRRPRPQSPPVATPSRPVGPGLLRRAAAAGDVAEVRALLASGAAVNETDGDGVKPLFYAANIDVVRALLEAGADLGANAGNLQFNLPLWSDALRALIRDTRRQRAERAGTIDPLDLAGSACVPGCGGLKPDPVNQAEEVLALVAPSWSASNPSWMTGSAGHVESFPGIVRVRGQVGAGRSPSGPNGPDLGVVIGCCLYLKDPDVNERAAMSRALSTPAWKAADAASREQLAIVLARNLIGPAFGALPARCHMAERFEAPTLRSEGGRIELTYVTEGPDRSLFQDAGDGSELRRVVVDIRDDKALVANAGAPIGNCRRGAVWEPYTDVAEPEGALAHELLRAQVADATAACGYVGERGKVRVRFVLDAEGVVSTATGEALERNTDGRLPLPPPGTRSSKALMDCAVDAIRSMWVPRPAHGKVRATATLSWRSRQPG